MKIKNLFLVVAIGLGLGLTACNKGEADPNLPKGTTYVSLSLSFDAPGTRAADDDYNSPTTNKLWSGNDKVEKLVVYTFEKGATSYDKPGEQKAFTEFQPTTTSADNKLIIKTKPFLTSAKTIAVVAVVNPTDQMLTALEAKKASLADMKSYLTTTAYERTFSRESLSACEGVGSVGADNKDLVPMTGNVVEDQVIASGVTEAEVYSGKNLVKVDLSRIASRVIVSLPTMAGTGYEVKDNSTVVGTIKDVKWSVGQFEKSYYFVQKKNATDVESPNYIFSPNSTDFKSNTHYDYSQLIYSARIAPAVIDNYATIKTDGKKLMEALATGGNLKAAKFITETTHKDGKTLVDDNKYVKGNTAYVLIQGTFAPAEAMWAAGEKALYVDGNDFVLGMTDRKFYTTVEKAKAATGAATDQKVQTFKKGKMIYLVWINPNDIAKPMWSPVHRNNVYHIHVTAFTSIGLNWNPLVPNNPNTPKDPGDPNTPPTYPNDPGNTDNPGHNPGDGHHNPDPNPDKPGDSPENPYIPGDPITTPKTYMGFEINVLGWTVHTYEVNVGVNP